VSFDYAKSQATATKLLTKFGQTVTRRTYTAGAYSTSTGASVQTTADTSRIGVLLDYENKGERYISGNLIQIGDKKLLLDGAGTAALTDRYIVQSVEYSVLSVTELKPAATTIMFELHLRVS
jgi:hypothetical protein